MESTEGGRRSVEHRSRVTIPRRVSTQCLLFGSLLAYIIYSQIASLPDTFEAVCGEVKRVTNLNTFILFGGPPARRSGGLQIFQ